MAGVAAMAAIANAVNAASPAESSAPQTRLGASIDQELGARDRDAVRRKRALDLREQAARATEARLKAQLDAQQPATTPADPAGVKSEEGDQYEELARIYQAMKPAKAAVVFEQLAMDVQMKVAQRMRERSTAMILASMTPKGAAALSMALARRYPQRMARETGPALGVR
jgi:flagellar motility protein MotE (MotC chaperone)